MDLIEKKKILVIAGCSQKKSKYPGPAIEVNEGQLFKAIKKLAAKHNFDIKILSGKYGLLDSETIIEPYNQKIRNSIDISKIRKQIHVKMSEIIRAYNLIIILMGQDYRKVLEPYFDEKFIIIYDKRGIGGYLSILSKFNNLTKKSLLLELEKFKITDKIPNKNITIKEKV